MKNHGLILLFLLAFSLGYSQSTTKTVLLKGQIVSATNQKALEGASILNLNSVEGTVSDYRGYFEVPTQVNDTIYISYLGHQSIKLKMTNDLLKGNELVISLYEKDTQLNEVVVKSTQLVGVLEIDVRQVPKDRFNRIHINGLSQTYEVGKPKRTSFTSPISAIFQPVDFLYNLFGKKPNQLRKLQKLKTEDNLRSMLSGKFDREVMMQYLEMDKQELEKLLSDCNYSEYFIKKASDLQTIEAVLDCYESYKAIKKGKIERNVIPTKKNN